MEAKTIVITGASDGIGAEAARQLHHHGHQVVVVGRSASKTNAVGDELGVDRHIADFSRLADVRRLAADLRAARPRIDVLANNAGGIFGDRTKTGDGFDLTFQVNHLAPFLLTHLLLDVLTTSGASVIQTSSAGARLFGNVALDDLEHDRDFTLSAPTAPPSWTTSSSPRNCTAASTTGASPQPPSTPAPSPPTSPPAPATSCSACTAAASPDC